MLRFAHRFDESLDNVRADNLKTMARLWIGKGTLRKDQALAAIRQGLADPAQVRNAVAGLEPFERAALALVKQAGGAINYKVLAVALLASGVPIPPKHRRGYDSGGSTLIRALIQRGLLLASYTYDPTYLHEYGGGEIVFADERLLAAIAEELPFVPVAVPVASSPSTTTYRQPSAVAISVMALLQAVDALGGLRLTQKAEMRVADLRKLQRALQWPEEGLEQDGLYFANAFNGVVDALRHSDWMGQEGDTLALKAPIAQIAEQPYSTLASTLLNGFLRLTNWQETASPAYASYYNRFHQQGRLILSIALKSLPLEETGFFTFADFSRALFDRVGEHFSLKFVLHQPYTYGKPADEVRKLEAGWRAKLWADWQAREEIWLQQALIGWLYFLGLVEIGWRDQQPVSFRLTEQPGATDLLIEAQLDHWATRQAGQSWQLTADQISTVGRSRQKELFRFLTTRLRQPWPPLLKIALNHWLGIAATTVEVAPVTILRCPEPTVMAALQESALFKPYIRGAIAPNLLVVETAQVAALQQHLAWAGLTVHNELILQNKRSVKRGKS